MKFLLPLQFSNAGGADGIVHWVALRLTIDGDTASARSLLSPVAEVDMQRFIQAKRRLEADNTIEPFTSFPLEAKRSLAKFVLFDVGRARARQPAAACGPGATPSSCSSRRPPCARRSWSAPSSTARAEAHRGIQQRRHVYLINYQISLPGVRRELAGLEWLPRAAA